MGTGWEWEERGGVQTGTAEKTGRGGVGPDWIVAVADAEMGHPDSAEGERRGEERERERARDRDRDRDRDRVV